MTEWLRYRENQIYRHPYPAQYSFIYFTNISWECLCSWSYASLSGGQMWNSVSQITWFLAPALTGTLKQVVPPLGSPIVLICEMGELDLIITKTLSFLIIYNQSLNLWATDSLVERMGRRAEWLFFFFVRGLGSHRCIRNYLQTKYMKLQLLSHVLE